MSRSAERIVSLLWLLLEAGSVGRTKDDIFQYLYEHQNTSATAKQRQFSRDKEALTSIGVPIQWRHNTTSQDVYVIDHDRLYLPDLALTDNEILALHQARALWRRSPMEDAIYAALARMASTQPAAEPLVGAQLATSQTLLADIVASARDQQPIHFRYRTVGRDEIADRRVRPWAVLMAHQHWYVVGWDLDRGDERIFRLTRIESKSIAVLPWHALHGQTTVSLPPADFNAADIRQRLHTEYAPAEAYVWIPIDAATGLRVRAQSINVQNGWELVQFSYRDPVNTAARIAAATTHALVDVQRSSELAQLVATILTNVRDVHAGPTPLHVPELTKVIRRRRRPGDRDVIARRLGIVAVVNQHGGKLSRAALRERFNIDDATLTDDLSAMQFWGMPEVDFAGGQFELDPNTDPVTITNAELLAQPWHLSTPEALGLISGLNAVPTIPGVTIDQRAAALSLEKKLREVIDRAEPQLTGQEPIVHPDLSLGEDDDVAEVLHRSAQQQRVATISYYSESSGNISSRDIEPLRLVYASGHGYVHGWCRKTQGLRTFRLDRVGSATITDYYFDPAVHGQTMWTIAPELDGQAFSVIVHATHRHRDVLEAYHPSATKTVDDGSIFAELAFQTLQPLLDLLTAHAGQIIVVGSQDLRDRIWYMTDQALKMHY